MKFFVVVFFALQSTFSLAQSRFDSISIASLQKHVQFLASDSMKGRGNYTYELYQCAQYIAGEYHQLNLQTMKWLDGYFQPFAFKKAVRKLKDTSAVALSKNSLLNVIGMLPGKSKASEMLLFCAHYDHLGIKGGAKRKLIYNGANDNAAGVASLIALAEYYAMRNDNERTLLFCAFSGEEMGLFGSEAFANIVSTDSIKAVINFDMIGWDQGWKRSLFITGAGQSNFEQIFKQNIPKGKIHFRDEPPEEKQFYQRSDNYPFAQKGVVAHSIMTTDDNDPCYHEPCDDIERIDFKNLKEILDAVIAGCSTIISGKDTPR